MDVRYHYGDVLVVVVCSTIVVVVGLIVSRILSIVDVVFAIKFVMKTVHSQLLETAGL